MVLSRHRCANARVGSSPPIPRRGRAGSQRPWRMLRYIAARSRRSRSAGASHFIALARCDWQTQWALGVEHPSPAPRIVEAKGILLLRERADCSSIRWRAPRKAGHRKHAASRPRAWIARQAEPCRARPCQCRGKGRGARQLDAAAPPLPGRVDRQPVARPQPRWLPRARLDTCCANGQQRGERLPHRERLHPSPACRGSGSLSRRPRARLGRPPFVYVRRAGPIGEDALDDHAQLLPREAAIAGAESRHGDGRDAFALGLGAYVGGCPRDRLEGRARASKLSMAPG
jgi:hypothetical protein